MDQEEQITQAAELAERILEEVASAEQDWRLVARLARELAALAEGMAPPPGAKDASSSSG